VFVFYRTETLLAVQTDVFGKYRLIGMPAGNWRVFAEPPEGQSLVAVERRVKINASDNIVTVDYTMPRGVTVTGQVTDRNTGEPVPGTISSYVFTDNPHLKPLKPSSVSTDRHSANVDNEGRFEIVVLPGPGILTFMASSSVFQNYRRGIGWDQIDHHITRAKGNHTMFRTQPYVFIAYNCTQLYEVDIPDIIGTHQMDLVVGEERIDVPLEIVRLPGGPTQVYYSNEGPDGGPFSLVAFDFTRQELEQGMLRFFDEKQGRVTQARSQDYKWAGFTYVWPSDESARLTLVEAATVRGRVLDADGKPLAGSRLHVPYDYDPSKLQARLPSQPKGGYYPHTEEEGRFELVGLAPDLPLTVMIDQENEARSRLLARHYLFEDLQLKVGETRDLGDLRIDDLREWTSQ
jgi:hypothetical protein